MTPMYETGAIQRAVGPGATTQWATKAAKPLPFSSATQAGLIARQISCTAKPKASVASATQTIAFDFRQARNRPATTDGSPATMRLDPHTQEPAYACWMPSDSTAAVAKRTRGMIGFLPAPIFGHIVMSSRPSRAGSSIVMANAQCSHSFPALCHDAQSLACVNAMARAAASTEIGMP